jgi:hypothetical protein
MITIILVGFAFVVGTVAFTLAIYMLMRWIAGERHDDHTKDLAGSVMGRVAALHGLILALIFAQEMIDYQNLRSQVSSEAGAIEDIYFDAERYGKDTWKEIRESVYTYIDIVIAVEWAELGTTDQLSVKAWKAWGDVYTAILDLTPETEKEKSLRDHMLTSIHNISDLRLSRENHGADSTEGMFWFAAVCGIFFIALGYYTFPPRRVNIILLSLFGAYTGVILFFIYSFSNPFDGPGAVRPMAMIRLQGELDNLRDMASN